MAITLKQAVTTQTTCELSALKEGILAVTRIVEEGLKILAALKN